MPNVSWKLFWVVIGGVMSLAVAGLPTLLHVGWWVKAPGLLLVTAVFVGFAHVVVHGSKMFAELPRHVRVTIVRWIAAAAAVHAALVVVCWLRPGLWPVWLLVACGLGVLEYLLARGQEYLFTRITRGPSSRELARREAAAVQDIDGEDDTTTQFRRALKRAGLDWLSVLGWEPIGDPAEPFGVRFKVRRPSRMAVAESGAKNKEVRRDLDPSVAESIAIALGEVLKTELMSDWVQITKEPAAGVYSVVVVGEDVMARVYEFVDTLEETSVTVPAPIGHQIDGQIYHLPLKQHGQAIGMSTSGKSSLINSIVAYVTRCMDAVLWVAGVEKLYDLVAGWLEPYTGTDLPLPIDWVANGQQDTVDMLVAAMTVARYRQNLPMNQRGGWPSIILVLDEASFALANRVVKAVYQGRPHTAAQMVENITKGAASGDVHIILASQRSTNDNFGDEGGNTTANIGWSAAFRSKDEAEIGRLTGDYKLPMPRHQGSYWLDPGPASGAELPVLLKAEYIQSIDPTKPPLAGLTVADVARTRHRFHVPLDPGAARAAGAAYARRHTRMDDELLRYLTNAVDLEPAGPSPEHQAGFQQVMRDFERLGIGPAATPTQPSEPAGPAAEAPGIGAVATLAERRTRADRVLEIVRSAEAPMARGDIITALRESGDETSDQVVTNLLKKMIDDRLLDRRDGLYEAM